VPEIIDLLLSFKPRAVKGFNETSFALRFPKPLCRTWHSWKQTFWIASGKLQ